MKLRPVPVQCFTSALQLLHTSTLSRRGLHPGGQWHSATSMKFEFQYSKSFSGAVHRVLILGRLGKALGKALGKGNKGKGYA